MHPSRVLRKRLAFDQGIITPTLLAIYSPIECLLRVRSVRSITEKLRVPKTKALISVVDDDESLREALTGLLRSLGFAVEAFPSAVDFLASPTIGNTSCLIADIHMPRVTGIELHSRLTELGYAIPTILITAYPDDAVRARALANGVVCYLRKPFDDDALIACIGKILDRPKPDQGHS